VFIVTPCPPVLPPCAGNNVSYVQGISGRDQWSGKFEPDDKVIGIYDDLYPEKG